MEACSGGGSSSGGSSAVPAVQSSFSLLSRSSSSFALSFPFLLPADCCAIRVFNALVNGSSQWLVVVMALPNNSTDDLDKSGRRSLYMSSLFITVIFLLLTHGFLSTGRSSSRQTSDDDDCHHCSSPSSSSSSLVASCQQDDHPPGKRRTMTTTIAATMATDRPPYRLSPLHLGDVAITSSCPPCVGHFRPLSFRHCCHPTLRCHHSPHARHSHRRCCLSSCVIPTTISESFVLIISPPGHHPARIHFWDDAPPAPSSPHTQQHPRGLVRGGGRRRTQGDIARRRPRPGRGLGG